MQNAKERMNCGVSIDFLVDFNDRLFKGVEAPGVQLFVCTRDSNHFGYGNKSYSLKLKKGETVQFIYEADTDEWYGYVPNKGEGTFDPRLVRPKVREEWSIQDVVQHVVKPATYNGSTSYVNSMLKQSQVGKPYKGVMVQPATRDTPFRNFVQSMGSYFDRVDAREDRFIWLDAFCAPQRENSGFAFANANMSAKFSTRVHYFAAPSLQQKSMNKNKNRSQSVLLGAVFVGNQKDQQLVTICLDYGLVEGITKIVAHLKFLQMILNIHAAVFGEAYEQYGSNGNGKGKGKGQKSGKKGINGKKSKYFNSKKGFRLSSSGSGKGSKFGLGFGSSVGSKSQLGLNNSVATKKKKSGKFNFDFDFGFDLDESMLFEKGVDMKMKGKGKGKGKNGKNYSAIGEVMELTPEEVLTNDAVVDALTDLIPEQDRPELAQQDFLNAILSNTTLL